MSSRTSVKETYLMRKLEANKRREMECIDSASATRRMRSVDKQTMLDHSSFRGRLVANERVGAGAQPGREAMGGNPRSHRQRRRYPHIGGVQGIPKLLGGRARHGHAAGPERSARAGAQTSVASRRYREGNERKTDGGVNFDTGAAR